MKNKKVKIGFTGTQKGLTAEQYKKLSDFISIINNTVLEFHHGDCIGADEEFHTICETFNIEIVIHPPLNESKRAFCESGTLLKRKEYLERNRDIVNSTDVMIVCPDSKIEKLRSGTWSTYRYAIRKNKPIFIFYPDGTNKNLNYI